MNYNLMAIGGFLGLEKSIQTHVRWRGAVNSGRSGLEMILREYRPTRLLIPGYICNSVPNLLQEIGQPFDFYHIDSKLEIGEMPRIANGEMLLYVNYYGIKDDYCNRLQNELKGKLILDLSQAFFYQNNVSCPSFSSIRKFFGVPDGCLTTGVSQKAIDELPVATGADKSMHLTLRVDDNLSAAYPVFKQNDGGFKSLHPMQMSTLTHEILSDADFKNIRNRRLANFNYLHTYLKAINALEVGNISAAPLAYPLYVNNGTELKKELIDRKIFVPTYWPNLINADVSERKLITDVIPLPIDQRYTIASMFRMVRKISDIMQKYGAESLQPQIKVYIRPLRHEDALTSWRWRNDAEVWRYTFKTPDRLITPEMELEWIDNVIASPSRKCFAICVVGSDQYIGNVQLTGVTCSTARLGIFIGEKEYWNCGVGTQAVRLLLDFAFGEMKLQKVDLLAKAENASGLAAYSRNGFKIISQNGNEITMICEYEEYKND